MLKKILLSVIVTAAAVAHAATPYATLASKASRFFNHGEWASASAMYTLMLDQRPDSAGVYGHAIVSSGMLGDTPLQIELFTRGLDALIPIDTMLRGVEQASLEAGESSLYEQFLYTLKERELWLERVIDSRLLDYYVYRDNGPGMVTFSEIMLAGLPDSERFLYTLARGQLLSNDVEKAVDTYRKINSLYPDSREALLYLGNYYASSSPQEALTYLQRALDQHYTPYLAKKVESLSLGRGLR